MRRVPHDVAAPDYRERDAVITVTMPATVRNPCQRGATEIPPALRVRESERWS
jgi:hypothetical protein